MRTAEKSILKFDLASIHEEEFSRRRLFHRHFVLPCVSILCYIQQEYRCSLSCSGKTRIAFGDDLTNSYKDESLILFEYLRAHASL